MNDLKQESLSDNGDSRKSNRMKGAIIALICVVGVALVTALIIVLLRPGSKPEPIATQELSGESRSESAGISESEVRELQNKLIAMSLLPPGSDSGSMDQATKEALERFQVRLNEWQGDELVTPNGEPNALTLTWLDFYCKEKQKETSTRGPEFAPTPEPREIPCVFTEPAIEAVVRKVLGKATGDIYQSELEGIMQLDLSNKGIRDIRALSGFTNLTSLHLSDNEISDISALSGLTNLKVLNLDNNDISDISALSGLTNLTKLDLSGNPISDFSPLDGLGAKIIRNPIPTLEPTHLSASQLPGANPAIPMSAWPELRSDELSDKQRWGDGPSPTVFGSEYSRDSIGSITFTGSLEGAYGDTWDVSAAGDGSVLAWVIPADGELYDLVIAGEGGVRAPENCRTLFSNYKNLETVRFNGCFDTSGVTEMGFMFEDCHTLRRLDLTSFDTSHVENLSGMFDMCKSLEEVDLTSFDTSHVVVMEGVFNCCESLERLDLSSFDTHNVESMMQMFCGCTSLREIYTSPDFVINGARDMMFEGCPVQGIN